MGWVRTLAWVIGIIYATVPSYWLLVHGRARIWATRGGRRLAVVGPFWIFLWIIAAAVTWPWRLLTFYTALWMWAPACVLFAAGFSVYALSARSLSIDQVLGRPELQPHKHEQSLTTGGIRARLRHPLYLGHLCELLGWTVGTGLVVLYLLTTFAVITGYFMIRAEERELEQRFGDSYRSYKATTPMLVPRLFAMRRQ
jgi:protein-S-isoprenylcysteine O-methyltransferase Ste14